MNDKETEQEKESNDFALLIAGAVLVISLMFLLNIAAPKGIYAVLFLAFPLFYAFFAAALWCTADRQQRRKVRREAARKIAHEKSVKNLRAQLNKRDFGSRLNSFVESSERKSKPVISHSRMKFWQQTSKYERTPTRTVELIRTLLQRISKIVSGGQKR